MTAPLRDSTSAQGHLQFVHTSEEQMRREIGWPWFPGAHALGNRQRSFRERLERDGETFSHRLSAPAGNVKGLAGGGKPVGMFMRNVACRRPGRQPVARIHGCLPP